MKTIEPENRKYFSKFGTVRYSSVDWKRESLKPLARCSFCVKQYGDAPKHDHLVLESRQEANYLCCAEHRTR